MARPIVDYAGSRVLVCLLPGLGDALASSPLLRSLADAEASVDVLAMLPSVAEYARNLGIVANVTMLPLLDRSVRSLRGLLALRARRYHTVFLPFPATRWQYAFVGRITAKGMLVAHRYGALADVIMGLGQHRLVNLEGGHRAWENMRLFGELGGSPISYVVPASWRAATVTGLIGLHPGTMAYKGNEARRWPLPNFRSLAERQLARGRRVRIFLGPNELADISKLQSLTENRMCELIVEPLAQAARKVAECEVFVANDAGFAHLAAGLGVRTVTLFGMTSSERALALGPAVAVRTSLCPPCHDEGMRRFNCVKKIAFRCINEDLALESVSAQVERVFEGETVANTGSRTSNFRLYGRARTKAFD